MNVRLYARRLVWLLALALCGCASLYFDDAGAPPQPPPQHALKDWPWNGYWTGIVFNGNKIGFSHLRVTPLADSPGRYAIDSEASFVLKFLGLHKRFQLVARDLVREDLTLVGFEHDYQMDGNRIALRGEARDGVLTVAIDTGGNRTEQRHVLSEPLYSTAVVALYPVLHGLAVGRSYRYLAYDGQLQTLAEVEQEVHAYERSELFTGTAFQVRTRLHGHRSTTWINAEGLPVFELALNGVLIAALETEAAAKRYLVAAALNKQETMLDFSLVRVDRPIRAPRAARALTVALSGLALSPPSDAWQRCRPEAGETVCEIRSAAPLAEAAAPGPEETRRYLDPTLVAPSYDPRIRATAQAIAGDAREPATVVARLVTWLDANIRKEPVDVFSALDVLEKKRAECQGHSYLYTALARALGVPTRIVNGLVYAEELQGFLYHTWTESLLDGRWLPIDPTFGQVGADATHIKLIEGERPADLVALVETIGRLRLRVVSVAASD